MDSVFRAVWLATQTRDSVSYLPPGNFLDFAREFSLNSQKKGTIWYQLHVSTGLVYTKTIINLCVGEEW